MAPPSWWAPISARSSTFSSALPSAAVAAAVVVGAVLAGVYVERLCFAPFSAGAGIASMVSSFAIWMQLEQASILVLPRHSYPFPPLGSGEAWQIGPFLLRPDHLSCSAALLAISAALYAPALPHALRPGAARHHRQSHRRASRRHRRQGRHAKAFALASAIGGVAGFLVLAGNQQVTAMFGMWATLKGLIAMMIGGLGSIPGAIVGGLLLGLVEAHAHVLFGPQVRDLSAYLVLFARARPVAPRPRSRGARKEDERWTTI